MYTIEQKDGKVIGICLEDEYEYKSTSLEEVESRMESHEEDVKMVAEKEREWLLRGDIRNKLLQLNENIDSLIDVAHDTYMITSDTENRARLDAQIKAYWNVKSMVEDVLSLDS